MRLRSVYVPGRRTGRALCTHLSARDQDSVLRTWIDWLLEREIVTRGFTLLCERCRYAGWYALNNVGRDFRCIRCRHQQVVRITHWKDPPDEPLIYYELSEVVYQAARGGFRPVILGLRELEVQASDAFSFAPELEVLKDGEVQCELDIWAIVDAEIYVGEAKSGRQLARKAKKEESIARRLVNVAQAATADGLVLASSDPKGWRDATKSRVESIADDMDVLWMERLGL